MLQVGVGAAQSASVAQRGSSQRPVPALQTSLAAQVGPPAWSQPGRQRSASQTGAAIGHSASVVQLGRGAHRPASQISSAPQTGPLGWPHPATQTCASHTVTGGAQPLSSVHIAPVDSGTQRPVVSSQTSPAPHPAAPHPATQTPRSHTVLGGAHSRSMRQPPSAMQRPVASSQTSPVAQTTGLLIFPQPPTHSAPSHTVVGGRHWPSFVHSGRSLMHAPALHTHPVGQCALSTHGRQTPSAVSQ